MLFASRAPASNASQQKSSHARTPSGVPLANPSAVSRYLGTRRKYATSGTLSAFGSRPVATIVSRAAARATTPSALPNGLSANSSPCTTAVRTGPGTDVAPVTSWASISRRPPPECGRPKASGSLDEVRRGEDVQPCQGLHRRAAPRRQQRLQRFRDAQRAGEDRVADRAVGGQFRVRAFDPGGRAGGPHRRLGRRRRAAAEVGREAVHREHGVLRGLRRRRDTFEVEQGLQRVVHASRTCPSRETTGGSTDHGKLIHLSVCRQTYSHFTVECGFS